MTQLTGRVFTRLQQYDALPTELKDEVERLEQYLVTIQSEVFGSHRTLKLKSIYGVRRRELLEKIEAWVQQQHGRMSNPSAASATGVARHGTTSTSHHLNQPVDQRLNQHHDHQQHGSLTSKVQDKIHEKTNDRTHDTHSVTPTSTPANLNVDNYQHAPESHHAHQTDVTHPSASAHATHQPHSTHPSDLTRQTHPSDLTHSTHPSGSPHLTHPSDSTHHTHQSHQSHQTATPTPIASNVGNFQIAGSATPATVQQTPLTTTTTGGLGHATSPHATQLLDALVLIGFVTPHKEDKPDDAPSATDDLELKDNEFLIARGNDVAVAKSGNVPTTVWDLVDGAVFAGMLKRKAGLLEPLTHGKDTYAIVNRRLKNLTLFKSDLGRKPVAQMDASKLKVAFDKTHYEHGVKVWSGSDTELLNAPSASESDALVQALLAVGATQDQQPHHGHAMTGVTTTTGEKIRHEVKKATGSDRHTDTKHHDQHGLTGDKHHTMTGDKHHTMTGDEHHVLTGDKHVTGDIRGSSMAPPADAMKNQHHGWETAQGEHGIHGQSTHVTQPTTPPQLGANALTAKHGEYDHSGHPHGHGQEPMIPNQHQPQSGHVQSSNPLTHGEYPSHTTEQQPSHPMKTEAQQAFEREDHAKRSEAPRGFSQVHEPTIAP